MPVVQNPPTLQFTSITAMARAAMEQTHYDAVAAVPLMLQWLETDDALMERFGKELWHAGAVYHCTWIRRNSRMESLASFHAGGRIVHTATAPADAADASQASTAGTPPPAPAPDASSDGDSPTISLRSPAPQRPTGEEHLAGARVMMDAEIGLDFRLGKGKLLGDATKTDIRAYIASYSKGLTTQLTRHNWLVLVLEALPDEESTVRRAFDATRLKTLYQEAATTTTM